MQAKTTRSFQIFQHASMLCCTALALILPLTTHFDKIQGLVRAKLCNGWASNLHHHSNFHKALPRHVEGARGCAAVAAQEVVCVLQEKGADHAGGGLGVGHGAAHDIHHLHVFLNSLQDHPSMHVSSVKRNVQSRKWLQASEGKLASRLAQVTNTLIPEVVIEF